MNNRLIKFRAWDDISKRMYSPLEIFNTHNAIYYEDNADGNLNINLIEDSYGKRRKLNKMQFTGLLDKNNKEIYEGDIVRYKTSYHFDEESIFITEVKFNNGQFYPIPINHIEDEDDFYSYYIEDYEVIGNIFENKELLDKK